MVAEARRQRRARAQGRSGCSCGTPSTFGMRLKALSCCWVGAAAISYAGKGLGAMRAGAGFGSFVHGPAQQAGQATRRGRAAGARMATAAPPRRIRPSVPMSPGFASTAAAASWPRRESSGGSNFGPGTVAPRRGAPSAKRPGGRQEKPELPFFDYRHLGLEQPRASARSPEMTMMEALGRAKLLTAEEERELGRKIQQLMEYEEARETLTAALQRPPTPVEWALAVGEPSPEALQATLADWTEAKHVMVRANMRLVVAIAKRYYRGTVNLQDLVQEGSLGLIRAAEKYDPERGFKFSTYAAWWIQQAIFKGIAYHSRLIRLPVHVHNVINSSRRARRELVAKLGRSPSEAEVAETMGIPLEKLRRYWRANRKMLSTELRTGRAFGAAAHQEWVLGDTLESKDTVAPEESAEMRLFQNSLQQIVQGLPDEERRVVTLRYGLDDGRVKTLQEIAELSRHSKDWVRKTETRALRKLRAPEHQERLVQFVEQLAPPVQLARRRRASWGGIDPASDMSTYY